MKIGYARVSTKDQSLNLQEDALKKAGCKKIYSEQVSGAKANRTKLNELMGQVREGDVIVVWKLDRLGRSLRDLVSLMSKLHEMGVGFKSLQDSIDTTVYISRKVYQLIIEKYTT